MNDDASGLRAGRILVVDNAAANLQLLTSLLSERGYTVHPASDGELALEFVRSTLPDLILLDIRMPGMDGYEVCRRLKADERARKIPVIFISILEDGRDKVKGFREGAVDYITKPFQQEEVLARIGLHLRLRELTERLEEKVAERTEELHRLNRELRAISSCDQALVRAEDEKALLEEVCRIVCDEAGYRMSWVGYAEHDEAKTLRPVAWAGIEEGYLAKARITWADTERGRGPFGTSIRSGSSSCIQDFTTDPQAAPWREEALRRGYRASISLPLKNAKGEAYAALAIYSVEPNAFTQKEIRLLEELAADLAFGIEVLRTRAEHKRAENEVQLNLIRQKALLDLYQTMAAAPIRDIISFVLDKCVSLTGSDIGFIGLICDDDRNMEAHLYTKKVMDNCPLDKPAYFPIWEAGLWAEPIRQRKTVIVDDYREANPQKKGYPKGHLELTGFMGVPVLDDGRVAAVACVANKPERYAETDRTKVSLLLEGMWDLIKRRRAEEELRRLNEALEQRVRERTAELERTNADLLQMNKAFVGRELRMVELKQKMKELER